MKSIAISSLFVALIGLILIVSCLEMASAGGMYGGGGFGGAGGGQMGGGMGGGMGITGDDSSPMLRVKRWGGWHGGGKRKLVFLSLFFSFFGIHFNLK